MASELNLVDASLDAPPGEPMRVTGRIDRIDYCERENAWLVLDYKMSESASSPEKAHHGTETCQPDSVWNDVQLPLYRHLMRGRQTGGRTVNGEIHVGYFCLPKRLEDAEIAMANWDDAMLERAVEVARGVVRDIRAGKFDMNPDFESGDHDEFARICQSQSLVATGAVDGTAGDTEGRNSA